jgi:hypothetical protein
MNLLNVNIFMHKTTNPAVSHLAADALLEIFTASISAVLSFDEHLSHTDTFFVLKVYCQSYSFIRDLFLRKINPSEQQQTISMLSNVRDLTYVLLVNTPYSHQHSFSATGLSSGLATRVTFTGVSRRSLRESITRGGPVSDFIFRTVVLTVKRGIVF